MSQSAPAAPRPGSGVAVAALACAALGGVLRWWVHRDMYGTNPTLLAPALDDAYYVEMVRRLASGGPFDGFLAQLHPWMASVFLSATDVSVAALGGLNAVLGALTSGVVALAAGWAAGRPAAWCAGVLHALAGVFLFHDVLPGQEAAIGLATAVAVAAGVALAERRLARWTALSATVLGAAVGMAALGRGTSLALLAVAVPGLARHRHGRTLAGLCAIGLAVVLAAGAVHNQRVGGPFSPFPWSGGVNLYLTNGPDARDSVSMTAEELGSEPRAIEENALAIASRAEGRDVGPREAGSWWLRRTWETLGGAAAAAAHLGRKALLFWSSDERGSNHSAAAERDFATVLGLVPVSGWWLLTLGVGAWVLVRGGRPAADVPALAVVATWLALVVFFPVGRYRLPALVASTVLVGMATTARPGRRRLVAAGVLTVAMAGVAWLPVRERDEAAGDVGVAQALLELGRPAVEAEARLERALAADPDSGPALELLGRMRYADGDAGAAYDLFVRAASDRRTRFTAQVAALPALVDLGRLDEARDVAIGLLRERPDDVPLLAHAAIVAAAAGGMEEPRALLERARRIAPGHPAIAFAESRLR